MSEVNLKSLAKESGLSVSTVSRALRDAYDISAETKQRVQALAAERNYVANPYTSSLRKNQSKTIGVIIPNKEDYLFTKSLPESFAKHIKYKLSGLVDWNPLPDFLTGSSFLPIVFPILQQGR